MSPPPHTHPHCCHHTHQLPPFLVCQYKNLWIAQSASFLVKKHISSHLFAFFFFCLKKFAVPEGVGVGGRGGVTNRPGGWPAWCRAANLRTFSLQSLFKESEMLLISFYRFHLSPVSPSSFSLLTTRFLLLFTPCCFTFFLSRHSSLVQWKSRTVYCSFLFVSPLRVTVIC